MSFSKSNSYHDLWINPYRVLIGGGGGRCMQTHKIIWQKKLFNHKRKLILNFLVNQWFQFAVFQKRFAICELQGLILHPVTPNLKKNRSKFGIYSNVVLIPAIFKISQLFSEKILEGNKQFHYTFVKKKRKLVWQDRCIM